MSILSSELIWRKPTEVSNLPTNGGRMTTTSIPSAVKNNMFPNVPQAERASGSTVYRKAFIHVANDEGLALIAPKVYLQAPTPGDDRITLVAGTFLDMQSALTGSEQQYGAGTLNADVALDATQATVLVENAADNIYKAGMTVRISDRQTIDGTGNEQFLVLSEDATYVGNVATLKFATTPLAYTFSTARKTYVSSCYTPADVQASVSDWVLTSAAGTYNRTDNPVRLSGTGAIEQQWTLTFTSSTAFTCTGDVVGNIGAGTIGTNFVPANTAFSKPLFTLLAAGFGGTFAVGDTIRFRTHPSAVALWYKRVVPPGASSLAANKVSVGIDGESE